MAGKLDENYWSERYQNDNTGWDIGYVSTPLKEYIDQLTDKNLKILIPGAGNAYEAEYLWEKGFKNIYVLDLSRVPLDKLLKRLNGLSKKQLLHLDFFDLNESFDLILEQTFFCALEPSLRLKYVKKMNELLSPKGKLVGLLFKIPLYQDHPPFGGNENEYRDLFEPKFNVEIMEEANNSIPPRMGSELFIKMSPLEL